MIAPVAVTRRRTTRNPEVHHLQLAGRGEHNVLGFQIAMDDRLSMRFGQPRHELACDFEAALGVQFPASPQQRAKALALHVLHRDVNRFCPAVNS